MTWIVVDCFLLSLIFSQVLCTEYYVVPTNSTENHCHKLQYYAEKQAKYFVTDSKFVFLPGDHTLETNIKVKSVSRLVMRSAEPNQRLCGHHVREKQPVVINCTGKEAGFVFSNVTDLKLQGIEITQCGQTLYSTQPNGTQNDIWSAAIGLDYVVNFVMVEMKITHSHGYGIFGQGVYGNSSVRNCQLRGNRGIKGKYDSSTHVTHYVQGGNMALRYNNSCYNNQPSILSVNKSVISDGYSMSYAGGVDLILNCYDGGIHIILDHVNLSNNTGHSEESNIAIQLFAFPVLNSIHLNGCRIENTTSLSYKGAMDIAIYINSSGIQEYNIINPEIAAVEVEDTTFFNNIARMGSALIMRLFYSAEQSNTQVKTSFRNCYFINNRLNPFFLDQNGGIAVYIIVFKVVESSVPQFNTSFTNCIFANNSICNNQGLMSGTIYIEEHSSVVLENCSISENNRTGITAVHSYIRFTGNNTIENNNATWGGGLLLHDRAVMLLTENTTLLINNNNAANEGGGIFAEYESSSAVPLCFYQFDTDTLLNTRKLKHIHVHLQNNTARTGTAVYGGEIDKCYFLVDNIPWRNKYLAHAKSSTIFNTMFHYNITDSTAISSNPTRVCFCENDSAECDLKTKNMSVSPGESFKVNASTVGQRYGNTSGIIIAQFFSNTHQVWLGPNEETQNVGLNCTELSYSVNSVKEDIAVNLSLYVKTSSYSVGYTSIAIHITACPLGFTLDTKTCKCKCVPALHSQRINCNAEDHSILIPPGLWAGYNTHNNSNISTSYSERIVVKSCPHMYCRPNGASIRTHLHRIEQDSQCYLNRRGLLCGQCEHGLSVVFGTQRCKNCRHVGAWALFGILCVCMLAGILLVAFLLACNFTVTVGTINGFVLYANIVEINQEIYFPLNHNFIHSEAPYFILRAFIAWLNLDIGTEACFYDGMTTFSKTLLQFAFPIYIWLITGLLIWLSRKYVIFTRLMKNNGTKVLATLILLSYAKLSRAIALSLASTQLESGNVLWYYDASLPYYYGKHMLLFLIAVVFTMIQLPFTFGLLFIKHLPRLASLGIFRWINKLKPLFDAYAGPYTEEYRFWVGFKLLVRILLLISFTVLRSTEAEVMMVVIGVCTLLLSANYFYGGRVYKKRSVNIIEALLLLNLIIWSMTIVVLKEKYIENYNLVCAFAGTTFLGFCTVIVIYHLPWPKCLQEKMQMCFTELLKCKRKLVTTVKQTWGEGWEERRHLNEGTNLLSCDSELSVQ